MGCDEGVTHWVTEGCDEAATQRMAGGVPGARRSLGGRGCCDEAGIGWMLDDAPARVRPAEGVVAAMKPPSYG